VHTKSYQFATFSPFNALPMSTNFPSPANGSLSVCVPGKESQEIKLISLIGTNSPQKSASFRFLLVHHANIQYYLS
jgi:hypothetical protein